MTASRDNTVRVWDVSRDDRPAADLLALLQLQSGHRIDDTGAVTGLTPAELTRLWAELRPRLPEEFAVSRSSVRRWREGEIRASIQERNVTAAEFHLWWLVAELGSGKAK